MFPPTRIVCLTEETVETLYLLGEQDRIVCHGGTAPLLHRQPGLGADMRQRWSDERAAIRKVHFHQGPVL
jgi:iron complex transport system substrate-binding protein